MMKKYPTTPREEANKNDNELIQSVLAIVFGAATLVMEAQANILWKFLGLFLSIFVIYIIIKAKEESKLPLWLFVLLLIVAIVFMIIAVMEINNSISDRNSSSDRNELIDGKQIDVSNSTTLEQTNYMYLWYYFECPNCNRHVVYGNICTKCGFKSSTKTLFPYTEDWKNIPWSDGAPAEENKTKLMIDGEIWYSENKFSAPKRQ